MLLMHSDAPDQRSGDTYLGGLIWSLKGIGGGILLFVARVELLEGKLTHSVIGAFFEVYNNLGFGFLERFYVTALQRELLRRGHRVAREVSVDVVYKNEKLGSQRLDLIVDERLVVETKAAWEINKSATRQLYNYLRATDLEVGLVLHFGPRPKFYRVICPSTESDQEHPNASGGSV
jgi:GxxExxY protein